MTETLRLTDLSTVVHEDGLRRFLTFATWRRGLYYAYFATREVLTAFPHDIIRILQRTPVSQLRIESGFRPDADTTMIALYVHYSATGSISDMVQRQLAELGQLGFSIVFISMADRIPEDDWQAVRHLAALLVQRPNFGLDFGAWRDLMPEVQRRWAVPRELLLANDSVLGPIFPLRPLIDEMREGGDGLFGLTESLQNGPHLQSYMLLARGIPAVEDLMRFCQGLYIGHSKWLLVRLGEVRLSQWMRRRGHRVAALFGYDRLVQATVADPEDLEDLKVVFRRVENLDQLPTDAVIAALHRWPLNPTHHLWRVLVKKFNFPFLKTELIRRNPTRLSRVAEWQSVVPSGSSCSLEMLEAHLTTLETSKDPKPDDQSMRQET